MLQRYIQLTLTPLPGVSFILKWWIHISLYVGSLPYLSRQKQSLLPLLPSALSLITFCLNYSYLYPYIMSLTGLNLSKWKGNIFCSSLNLPWYLV